MTAFQEVPPLTLPTSVELTRRPTCGLHMTLDSVTPSRKTLRAGINPKRSTLLLNSEVVQRAYVFVYYLLHVLIRHACEILLQYIPRMGEEARRMRIVSRPAYSIDPITLAIRSKSHRVLDKSCPDIPLEVLTRRHFQLELMASACPARIILVPACEQRRNPRDIAFRADQPETRKPAQQSAEDHRQQRSLNLGLRHHHPRVRIAIAVTRAIRALLVASRVEMQRNRHVEVLRGRPETIVRRLIVARQMVRRPRPNLRSPESKFSRPRQFFGPPPHVPQRNQCEPGKP